MYIEGLMQLQCDCCLSGLPSSCPCCCDVLRRGSSRKPALHDESVGQPATRSRQTHKVLLSATSRMVTAIAPMKLVMVLVASAMCSLPAAGLDYLAGHSFRRSLQQGPGGLTCQTGAQSALYRCASTGTSNAYQFCSRLCENGLGRSRGGDGNPGSGGSAVETTSTPTTASSGSSSGNGGLNGGAAGSGSLGGSGLGGGSSGGAATTTASPSCTPCQDVQQMCQSGAGTSGLGANSYFRPYVSRYYSGTGCLNVASGGGGGGGGASPAEGGVSPSTTPSTGGSPALRTDASPVPGV